VKADEVEALSLKAPSRDVNGDAAQLPFDNSGIE
jgi:hypothetical protein